MNFGRTFNDKVVEPLLDKLNIPHDITTSWFLPEHTADTPHHDTASDFFMKTDGDLQRVRMEARPSLLAAAKGEDAWSVRVVGEFETTLSVVKRKVEHDIAMDQRDPEMFELGPYVARRVSKDEAMALIDAFEEKGLDSLMQDKDWGEPSRFVDDFYGTASTASNVVKEHARERLQNTGQKATPA